jgi:hypothetical protein
MEFPFWTRQSLLHFAFGLSRVISVIVIISNLGLMGASLEAIKVVKEPEGSRGCSR